jgi:ABC-2 type transport system permease protein
MAAVLFSTGWLLRRSATGLAALLAGVTLFEFIQPIAIASFGDLERLDAVLEFVPPAFMTLFNMTPEFLDAVGLAGFLALGFTHPVYHLLSGATVIWFSARSLAGEMERGSIQIALSRPMSRLSVYVARVVGMLAVTLMVSVAAPLGMIAGIFAGSPDGEAELRYLAVQGIASALLLACIGGVTLLISSVASRMGQAVGWAIGLLVTSYVIDYFAGLWDALEPIDPFSVFDYYDPPAALTRGEIPAVNVLVLAAIAAGATIFHRRDLP